MMRKTVCVLVGCVAVAASAGAASLADARAKIGDAIADTSVLTSTFKTMSAEDQVTFLAEMNAAIGKMPGSPESKAAVYLDANRAAIKAASGKGNVRKLLAESFATVSLEALTVMNERFAAELFNRAANPSVTYTDEQYVSIVKPMMEMIAERNKSADNVAERDALAVLMFVRASNGTPADLADVLLVYVPEGSRKAAKEEWLASALAEGSDKSYAPILEAAGDVAELNIAAVVRLCHPDMLSSLLEDLNNGSVDAAGYPAMPMTSGHMAHFSDINAGLAQGGGFFSGFDTVPFNYSRRVYGTSAGSHGSGRKIGDGVVYDPRTGLPIAPGGTPVGPDGLPTGPGGVPVPYPGRDVEPGGYQYQNI